MGLITETNKVFSKKKKATREKQQIIFKGIPTTTDLSTETAGQEGVAGYT